MEDLDDKNAWLSVREVLTAALHIDWVKHGERFKYLTLRLDTRNLKVRLFDRYEEPMSLSELSRGKV